MVCIKAEIDIISFIFIKIIIKFVQISRMEINVFDMYHHIDNLICFLIVKMRKVLICDSSFKVKSIKIRI